MKVQKQLLESPPTQTMLLYVALAATPGRFTSEAAFVDILFSSEFSTEHVHRTTAYVQAYPRKFRLFGCTDYLYKNIYVDNHIYASCLSLASHKDLALKSSPNCNLNKQYLEKKEHTNLKILAIRKLIGLVSACAFRKNKLH